MTVPDLSDPDWDDPTQTVTLAEVRASVEFEAGLAQRETDRVAAREVKAAKVKAPRKQKGAKGGV